MKILDFVVKSEEFDKISKLQQHEIERDLTESWEKKLKNNYTHVRFRSVGKVKAKNLFRIKNINTDNETKKFTIKIAQKPLGLELDGLVDFLIENNLNDFYSDGNLQADKFSELFISKVKELLSDDTLNFLSNNNMSEFKIDAVDQHTKEVLKELGLVKKP